MRPSDRSGDSVAVQFEPTCTTTGDSFALTRPGFAGSIGARKMAQKKAYAKAGVDIDLGNKVKATLPQLLASTHRREVLGKVGGFGGLFALDIKKYQEPVLVSSVDGVGTKLKIAIAMK